MKRFIAGEDRQQITSVAQSAAQVPLPCQLRLPWKALRRLCPIHAL